MRNSSTPRRWFCRSIGALVVFKLSRISSLRSLAALKQSEMVTDADRMGYMDRIGSSNEYEAACWLLEKYQQQK